ncbi:hypothetical protein C8Q75DRAFT_750891 [Abortiporus biennis]|nr:hypothetical protein C8Q75DRAFT_750891 [Abortiporus biennis]
MSESDQDSHVLKLLTQEHVPPLNGSHTDGDRATARSDHPNDRYKERGDVEFIGSTCILPFLLPSFTEEPSHSFILLTHIGEKMLQKLVLTTTSLHNVVISNSSDVIYYEIVTPKWEKHTTKISRLDPNTRQFDLIGELQNDEESKPVSMRLYGGVFKPETEFLKNEDGGKKSASFTGKDGKKYTWKGDHRRLELVRDDLPSDKPVAIYHRQKRYAFVLRMSRHPYLEIDSAALDTLDSLILSFLLVERRRRDGKY